MSRKYWSNERKALLKQCIDNGESAVEMHESFFWDTSYDAVCSARRRAIESDKANGTFTPHVAQSAPIHQKVHGLLKSGVKRSISDLADACDCPPRLIREAIESLASTLHVSIAEGDNHVWIGAPSAGGQSLVNKDTILMDPYIDGFKYKFGLISDNHMCSKYERLDIAEALYDVFASEGVSTVLNCGNWIDGEARFNKNDLLVHGMGNQFKYFSDRYPQRDGITTEFIGGDDHEGWYTQREGIDLGRMFNAYCGESRPDLIYTSYMEHDKIVPVSDGQCRVRMIHAGGGSSYAISYTTQKLIESLTGGEKPSVMLIGHYHKAEYIYYRNIHAIQAGCTQDQTPFMRKKRLSAHLGGWLVELTIAPDGSVRRCKQEFINFYDRPYHESEWTYKQ